MLMVKNELFQIIHKKPVEGGFSAVGGINIPTFFKPDAPEYADLKSKFIDHDIPLLMDALDLGDQPLPLIWTGDFIPADGPTPGSTVYIVGEFNCSCVGCSNFGAGCGPGKDLVDVSDENYQEGMRLTKLVGEKAIEALEEIKAKLAAAPPAPPTPVAPPAPAAPPVEAAAPPVEAAAPPAGPFESTLADRVNTKLPNPPDAKYKFVHVGFTSPGGDAFNTDKDKHGFRYDAVPIANGFIMAGAACDLIQYEPEKHDEMMVKLEAYDGFFVRINPGQLSNPGVPEGAQAKFDGMMREFVKKGKPVWSSPDVQTQMGAKDALVKMNHMDCGLADTYAYYSAEELKEGFKKAAAFAPRVIKQNRGSAGEGIWLCWLDGKDYCANLGDAILDDSDKIKLMEMNDNHTEYHTVGEFIEFCINGPGGAAGEWQSIFPGKYLVGGKEAGGQLVDQRLLPRISEGEVRP